MSVLDEFIQAVRMKDIDRAYNILVSNPTIARELERYVENYKDLVKHILELYMIKHNKVITIDNPLIRDILGNIPEDVKKLNQIIAKLNIIKTAESKDLDTLLKMLRKYRRYLNDEFIQNVINYKVANILLKVPPKELFTKLEQIRNKIREQGIRVPSELNLLYKMAKSLEELEKNKEAIASGVASHLAQEIKKKLTSIVKKYSNKLQVGLQNTEFITALELAGVPAPVINKAKMILQSKEIKEIHNILNQLESESKLPPEELSSRVFDFLAKVRELEQLLYKYRSVLGNSYTAIKNDIITMLNNTIPAIAYYLAGKGKYEEAIRVLNIASSLGANTGYLVSIINRLRNYKLGPKETIGLLHSLE